MRRGIHRSGQRGMSRQGGRRVLAHVAIGLSVLAASGCRHVDDETARFLSEPTERHAIGFSKGIAHLHVEAAPGGGALSDNQHADVARFVQGYRQQGTGTLRVSLPTTPRGHAIGGATARSVRALALDLGVPPDRIVSSRHGARGAEPAAVIVSYVKPEAVAPVCGDWSADLGRDHERVRHPQFGCATQRNIALNVANARDLVEPQAETAPSNERRFTDWTKYVGTPGAPGAAQEPAPAAKKPPKNPPPPAPSPQ